MVRGVSIPAALLLMLSIEQSGLAQIIPDQTLGQESSVLTPNVEIKGELSNQIDGGALRADTLFHSFSEFNVEEFERVYFANPVGIESIFSRVTGTDGSNIMGTLGVDGPADLFLLNPHGIVFGPNAQLDIAGSFLATTAEAFTLPNGQLFSAVTPDAAPLLSVSLKPGLQWQGTEVATINSQGQLVVGQKLTLAGGDLNLQGRLQSGADLQLQGLGTVTIRDNAAEPFVASSAGDLWVQGHQGVDIFALNHPNSGLFSQGDLTLRSGGAVIGDAHFSTGGDFRIEQLDGAALGWSSIVDPIIRSAGDVTFDDYTGASLHILAGGSVTAGDIEITGADTLGNSLQEQVTLSDGVTVVEIDGNAEPTLDIRAGTLAVNPVGVVGEIAGFRAGEPQSEVTATTANISIGNIINPGGQIFLSNQYQPNLSLTGGEIQVGSIDTGTERFTAGVAKGGGVVVDARDSVNVAGNITAAARAGTFEDFFGFIDNISSVGNDAEAYGGDITLFSGNNITAISLESSAIAVTEADQTQTFLENDTEQIEAGAARAVAVGGNITLESRTNMYGRLVTESVGNINISSINSSAQTLVDASVDASTEDAKTNGGTALAGTITTQARAGDVSLSTQVTGGDVMAESAVGTINISEIDAGADTTTSANATANTVADASKLANTGDIPTDPGTPEMEFMEVVIIDGVPITISGPADTGGPPRDPFALEVINFTNGGTATAGTIQDVETYGGDIALSTQVFVGDITAAADIGTISAEDLDASAIAANSAQSSANVNAFVPHLAPAIVENNGNGGTAIAGTIRNIETGGGDIVLQTEVATGDTLKTSHVGNISTTNINTASDIGGSAQSEAYANTLAGIESGINNGNGGLATGAAAESLQSYGGSIMLDTTITAGTIQAKSDIGNITQLSIIDNFFFTPQGSLNAGAFITVDSSSDASVFTFHLGDIGENNGNGGTSIRGTLQNFETQAGNISLKADVITDLITADSNVGNLTTTELTSGGGISVSSYGDTSADAFPDGINTGNGGTVRGGIIEDFRHISGEITLSSAVAVEDLTTGSNVGQLATNRLSSSSFISTSAGANVRTVGVSENSGDGGTASNGTIQNVEGRAGAILLTTQLDVGPLRQTAEMGGLQITSEADASAEISVFTDVDISTNSNLMVPTGNDGQIVESITNNPSNLILAQGGSVTADVHGDILTETITTSTGLSVDQGATLGNAGDVRLSSAYGNISLEPGASIQTNTLDIDGNGGDIHLSSPTLRLLDNTLTTAVNGRGDAGNIILNSKDRVDISGSRLLSNREFETTGTGTGGIIDITADTIVLNDFTLLNTSTSGIGDAGPIRLTATSGDIVLNDSSLFSLTAGDGDAGDITVQSLGALRINDNSVISTAVILGASGSGGDILVNAADGVFIKGTGLDPIELPEGNRSNIDEVEPNDAFVFDEQQGFFVLDLGSAQSVDTSFALIDDSNVIFSAEAPHVKIFGETNSVLPSFFQDTLDIFSFNVAAAGTQVIFDIDETRTEDIDGLDLGLYLYDEFLNSIDFNDNADVTLGGEGSINGNDPFLTYIFNEPGTYFIEVAGPISEFPGAGTAGSIIDRSIFTTPGSYTLNISRVDASLVNSGITTQTRTSGTAGNITINAPIIDIQNRGQISSESLEDGQAGNITLQPIQNGTPSSNLLTLGSRSTISAQATQPGGIAGNISIETNRVELNSGAEILASNQDAQTGGNISLQGLTTLDLNNGSISAETLTGRAGNIDIEARDNVQLKNGATLSVETKVDSSALTPSAPNAVISPADAVPTAGDLSIRTPSLTVADDSRILVQSLTGQAGNIDIEANRIALNNGEISAVTTRTPGSNVESATIDINGLKLLFLENDSLISARAQAGASGGNVDISGENAFIIAPPFNNSDIIATADGGAGGEITISVDQLFGFTQQNTPIGLANNRTNDISASSATGPQGIVTLNTLNVDPTQGLEELSEAFAESLSFDAVCNAAVSGGNEFTITGRGGLPTSPAALPNNLDPWEDWFMLDSNNASLSPPARVSEGIDGQLSQGNSHNIENFAEAQGWLVNNDGTVVLAINNTDTFISSDPSPKTANCQSLQTHLN